MPSLGWASGSGRLLRHIRTRLQVTCPDETHGTCHTTIVSTSSRHLVPLSPHPSLLPGRFSLLLTSDLTLPSPPFRA